MLSSLEGKSLQILARLAWIAKTHQLCYSALPFLDFPEKTTEVMEITWGPSDFPPTSPYPSKCILDLTAFGLLCVQLCASHSVNIILYNPHSAPKKWVLFPILPALFFFLTDKEIKVQRESVICRRSYRQAEIKLGLDPILFNSRACAFATITYCQTATPWGHPREG